MKIKILFLAFFLIVSCNNASNESSNIQDGSVCHTDDGMPLVVGDNVTVGHKIAQHIYTKATNMENKLFYVQILKTKSNVMEYKLTDEDNYLKNNTFNSLLKGVIKLKF